MAGEGLDALVDWTRLVAQFKGREAPVLRIAATALNSQAGVPARLRELAAARDFPALAMAAHSLKGMGGNLMATPVYELARQTDEAARTANQEALKLAEELAQLMEALLRELAEKVQAGRIL